MRVDCGFCGKKMNLGEYDFARWCKRELLWCAECYADFKADKNATRRI